MVINEHTTVDEAWRIAIQREKNAHQFYSEALKVVTDESLKKVFTFLAEEEFRHQKMMEDEYVKVFGKEPW